jgi:hypothetical protein
MNKLKFTKGEGSDFYKKMGAQKTLKPISL